VNAPPAWVTPVIIAANVVVFAAMLAAGAGLLQPDASVHIRYGSNFGPLTTAGEWWRLGASVFIHFGLLHLAFNMWALWNAGRLVEQLYGTLPFALLYAFAGVAGSLASVAWHPGVNSAGASGAIFGIIGALLVYVLNPRNGVPPAAVRVLRNNALVFVAVAVAFGLVYPGIDNAAHVGGLAGGALMGALLARPLDAARPASGIDRRLLLAGAAGALLVGVALQLLAHPSPGRAAELELRRDWRWFAEVEADAVARTRALASEVQATGASDAEFAARLEREVLPLWEEIADRLAPGYTLPPRSPLLEVARLQREYAAARREALRLFVLAARLQDPVTLDQATRQSQQADALAGQLRDAWQAAR
jgi:rhomboid protease GluP